MEHYIASLIFQIRHEIKPEHIQFEEIVCLVKGEHYQGALEAAEHIGRLKQISITDVRGHAVHWYFIGVSQIELTSAPDHGSELFSHIRIQENANEFVEYIRSIHENLRTTPIKEELAL